MKTKAQWTKAPTVYPRCSEGYKVNEIISSQAPPFTSCVTLGKLPNISEAQFMHLEMETIKSFVLSCDED